MVALRVALAASYDICRATPNLVNFVADRCPDRDAARVLRGSRTDREAWLKGRNGLDVVEEFAVRGVVDVSRRPGHARTDLPAAFAAFPAA